MTLHASVGSSWPLYIYPLADLNLVAVPEEEKTLEPKSASREEIHRGSCCLVRKLAPSLHLLFRQWNATCHLMTRFHYNTYLQFVNTHAAEVAVSRSQGVKIVRLGAVRPISDCTRIQHFRFQKQTPITVNREDSDAVKRGPRACCTVEVHSSSSSGQGQ